MVRERSDSAPTSPHQRAFKLSLATGESQMKNVMILMQWSLIFSCLQPPAPVSALCGPSFLPPAQGLWDFTVWNQPLLQYSQYCCSVGTGNLCEPQSSLRVWGKGHRPPGRSLPSYFPSGDGEDKICLKTTVSRKTFNQNSLSLGLVMVYYQSS